jgi:Domain of unknown function (DUF4872)/Butirosin biosynthesis protein H, N-terminal
MTEHRSLKRRVRERMSRTGESYTTAYRRVTAQRRVSSEPAAEPAHHQPSALARRLLDAAGLAVSEPMACGLGGGIGFLYAVFEYRQVEHPLLTIVAQHHPMPWLAGVGENLAIPVDEVHSSSPNAARQKLDRALTERGPVQLTVQRGRMPRHEPDSELAAADPYPVVVLGRHDDGYLVQDVGPEPYPVAADDLVAAWSGHRKGRFAMASLDAGAVAAIATDPASFAAGVRRAVRMTVAHLTGPVLGNSFDVNFGLSGMTKLAHEMADGSTRAGWARRFGTPAGSRYACRRLAECLTSAYTSAGATRPLYATFLHEAAVLLDEAVLREAGDLIAASGEAWTALAATAVAQGDGAPPAPAAVFAGFAETVGRCRDLEEQACRLLSAGGF